MRGSAHRFGSFRPFIQRQEKSILSLPLLYRMEEHVP
jgi:hypothetical protein